jgi:hypothetical protein
MIDVIRTTTVRLPKIDPNIKDNEDFELFGCFVVT